MEQTTKWRRRAWECFKQWKEPSCGTCYGLDSKSTTQPQFLYRSLGSQMAALQERDPRSFRSWGLAEGCRCVLRGCILSWSLPVPLCFLSTVRGFGLFHTRVLNNKASLPWTSEPKQIFSPLELFFPVFVTVVTKWLMQHPRQCGW